MWRPDKRGYEIGTLSRQAAITAVTLLLCLVRAHPADVPALLKKINPSVVSIYSFDSLANAVGQGSGFLIDGNHVITCLHVVEDADFILITTHDDSTYVVDSIVATDWEGDLVELSFSPEDKYLQGLPFADSLPVQGETVIVVGSPLGFPGSISDGMVAAVRDIPSVGQIIQITAPISPGSSGSPVINLRGQVVGIVGAQAEGGQNVNFAIPAERIVNIRRNYDDQLTQIIETAWSEYGTLESREEEAEQLMEEGSYAKAAKVWERVLTDTIEYFYGTFSYGLCLLNSGDYRTAAVQFDKANELSETSAAYFNKSLSLLYLDDSIRALAEIEKALKLDPVDSTYQFYAGKLCYQMEYYDRVISILEEYLDKYPSDSYALSLLCFSLYHDDQDESASKCFEMYLSRKPLDVDGREAYAWSLSVIGKYKEALKQFERCSQVRRGDYLIYWGMAGAQLSLGDTADALESYSIAVALDSTVAALQNDYGLLLYRAGKHREALSLYERANRMDPVEWRYLWNIGNAYLYLGYDDRGSEALVKAKFLKEATKSTGGNK